MSEGTAASGSSRRASGDTASPGTRAMCLARAWQRARKHVARAVARAQCRAVGQFSRPGCARHRKAGVRTPGTCPAGARAQGGRGHAGRLSRGGALTRGLEQPVLAQLQALDQHGAHVLHLVMAGAGGAGGAPRLWYCVERAERQPCPLHTAPRALDIAAPSSHEWPGRPRHAHAPAHTQAHAHEYAHAQLPGTPRP
jgi:hypothetical protein